MSLEGLQGYVLQVLAWLVLSTTTSFIALNRSAARGCTARAIWQLRSPRGSVDPWDGGRSPPSDSAAAGRRRALRGPGGVLSRASRRTLAFSY